MNKIMKRAIIIVIIILCFFLSVKAECALVSNRNVDVVTGMPQSVQERLKVILGH